MKRFKFKLESLLTVRKIEEHIALLNLSKMLASIQKDTKEQQRMSTEMQRIQSNWNEHISSRNEPFDRFRLSSHSNYQDKLQQKILILKQTIEGKNKELTELKVLMHQARTKREILEKIRTKEHENYIEDSERIDRMELLELNSIKNRAQMHEDTKKIKVLNS